MRNPRLAARFCFTTGLVILALTVIAAKAPAPAPCGTLPKHYAPIIAFELARSEADLRTLFGLPGDRCREPMIAHLDATNWVDVLAFIPVYAFFLICFFLAMRERSAPLSRIGVGVSSLAIAGDYAENLCLMNLTPRLDASSSWLAILPWATGTKWLALAAVAALGGLILVRGAPGKLGLYGLGALLCWAALPVTIAALVKPASFGPLLSPVIGVSWCVFLVVSGARTFRASSPVNASP